MLKSGFLCLVPELETPFPVRHPEVAFRMSSSLSFTTGTSQSRRDFVRRVQTLKDLAKRLRGKGRWCQPRGCHFGVSFGRLGNDFALGVKAFDKAVE